MNSAGSESNLACSLRRTVHRAYPWVFAESGEWRADVRGYAYYRGDRLDAARLATATLAEASAGALPSFVTELNGSFCMVVRNGHVAFAAVDRVRSLPLFWHSAGHDLTVADDPLRTLVDAAQAEVEPAVLAQVLRCGYAIGAKTMIRGVRQLQAGEYLTRSQADGLCLAFYYQHLHRTRPLFSVPDFKAELRAVSSAVFERLIDQLDGRACVVPLSGGYDSRYVLGMLFRLGYPHVLTYTYGARDSFEIEPARKTAQRLGYPWHFVEYNKETWARFLSSSDAARYLEDAGACAALPHVQEYAAILSLKQQDLIPPDGVFVPGFCGDLLGGSYVPEHLLLAEDNSLLVRGIARYICDTHMVLSNRVERGVESELLAAIQGSLADYPQVATIDDFVSVNEAWFTVHKVARFVVNSLRVYEHFGHEWLMPLWDNELAQSWYGVPVDHRCRGELYNEFLFEWLFAPLGVAFEKPGPLEARWPVSWVKAMLPSRSFEALRSAYVRGKMRIRPPDPNAFSELARLLRAEAAGRGLSIGRSPNINQALAVAFLSRECERLGASLEFAAVYRG